MGRPRNQLCRDSTPMRSRGFTIVELLVGLSLILTVSALVYTGVRPQVYNAGSQTRVALMQQSVQGTFDLLARDLRMAGYDVDLTVPGLPPPLSLEAGQLFVLYGNYSNVRTTGSGAGSTVNVADTTGFAVNNYLLIKSYLGGEGVKIAAVGSRSIQLATPLNRVYPIGSEVDQIEPIRYRLANGTLLRDGQPMADGVTNLAIQYYLDDGTLISDPTGVEAAIRTALVRIQTRSVNAPSNVTGETMTIQAEVRIRNLGLMEINRTP